MGNLLEPEWSKRAFSSQTLKEEEYLTKLIPDCKHMPADFYIRKMGRATGIFWYVVNHTVTQSTTSVGGGHKHHQLTAAEADNLWQKILLQLRQDCKGKTRAPYGYDGFLLIECPSLQTLDPTEPSPLYFIELHNNGPWYWLYEYCTELINREPDNFGNICRPSAPISPYTRQFWTEISRSNRLKREDYVQGVLLACMGGQSVAQRMTTLICSYEDAAYAFTRKPHPMKVAQEQLAKDLASKAVTEAKAKS
jgi:hypothetical protein